MCSPSHSFVLGILAGLVLGMPLLLVGGYLWQAGLDLRSPSSSREWIKLCARGREDIFCKAAQSVVAREVSGPVVLLYPGVTGDRDLTATLIVWKGRYPSPEELDALVWANLFAAAELKTGQMRSLDGQVRRVRCPAPDQRGSCQLGPLKVQRHTRPRSANDGAIYVSFGPDNQRGFLPPR
ncbi:hypothetical protein [Deinococcus planocerae]|uniref:hypothetical protein n=1 Tax=Deinococcus planocerae TaxID=1737569 RepID=UPI000C7EB542|nr:hypothetical protein [Deinococcus planocerae]